MRRSKVIILILSACIGLMGVLAANAAPYTCECTPGHTWFVSGDVNNSCSFNGLDVTYMVNYFKGGAGPMPCADCPPAGIVVFPGEKIPVLNQSRITPELVPDNGN